MTAEHMASIEPTDRSMWRATITKTMPQAMMATGTVCTAMLKTLRGPTKVPPVQIVKTDGHRGKGHQHAKKPHVDFQRVEHAAARCEPALGAGP